mmetsp:Transcript_17531/g.30686  ORF Transcript_17531/g.30686 Transcript_17531/m.30686 type:complete len:328 (+) Transcript_17531:96-1079(+)|eukprot:CAMPEP_0197653106 /NCGR_PEP_ID=MMETSP1338-20131121/34855_1 /TAXON_ID=43686 ORGANISM="Pelagodinium beii, Strain RCC1491" /NCGR_SAMPLE_ID=MMETSP1338 /ASSEMBLY_ACC=CAM_ASM_000754 /LENGTH=327 /DNA_ID=CAMNT_0043228115 /DNA_START=95 /DNA_END=1078 /DNA_ORIENTATION=-
MMGLPVKEVIVWAGRGVYEDANTDDDCVTVKDPEKEKEQITNVINGCFDGAAANRLASILYTFVAIGHFGVIVHHYSSSQGGRGLFAVLALIGFSYIIEAYTFALGDLQRWMNGRHRKWSLTMQKLAGRVRFYITALATPWYWRWAADLSCRQMGGGNPDKHDDLFRAMVMTANQFALFTLAWIIGQEIYYWYTAPDTWQHFLMNKRDMELTGRAIFVPTENRSGLWIAPGFGLLTHFTYACVHLYYGFCGGKVWLWGTVVCICARGWGGNLELWPIDESFKPQFRRELARLVVMGGELCWMWSCVLALNMCEDGPRWAARCGVGPF